MLDDLTKAVRAQLHERATSPLIGAFALTWAAWNYRLVFLLFSDFHIVAKLAYIDDTLYPSWETVAFQGFALPLLSALAIIFIYPIPARFVYEYWRNQQKRLKEIKQRIDDETPLTRDEASSLRREMIKATSDLEQELARRSAEVSRLREILSRQESSSIDEKSESDSDSNAELANRDLTDLEISILQQVASYGDEIPEKSVITKFSDDRVRTEYSIGVLQKNRFVTRNYRTQYEGYTLAATHDGRDYLINKTSYGKQDEGDA